MKTTLFIFFFQYKKLTSSHCLPYISYNLSCENLMFNQTVSGSWYFPSPFKNINIYILHTALFTFPIQLTENLFDNQEPLKLVIISYILMTFKFDSRVIL